MAQSAPSCGATSSDATPVRGRRVVCLCGSTSFREAFEAAARTLGLAGNIVLTVVPADLSPEEAVAGNATKDALDALHLDKILMSDAIFVVNVGGYVGRSTRREICFALEHHKQVEWLEPDHGKKWLLFWTGS